MNLGVNLGWKVYPTWVHVPHAETFRDLNMLADKQHTIHRHDAVVLPDARIWICLRGSLLVDGNPLDFVDRYIISQFAASMEK